MSDTDRNSMAGCARSSRRLRGLAWVCGGALAAFVGLGTVSSPVQAQTADAPAAKRAPAKGKAPGRAPAGAASAAARPTNPPRPPTSSPHAQDAPGMPGAPGAPGMAPPLPPGHPPIPPMHAGAGVAPHPPLPPGVRPPFPGAAAHEAEHAGAAHGAGHEGAEAHGQHGAHDPKAPPVPINWWHGFVGTKEHVEPSVLWRAPDEAPPFLATIFNFAVLAGLLVHFGRKPLAAALVKRKQDIMQGIDEAQRIRTEAEQRLRQYEEKFGRLSEEAERLRAELRDQGERDKERIVREARERATKLRADAEHLLEQELAQVRQALVIETVDNAVRSAGQLVVRQGTASDHERFAEVFLTQLKARGGAPARRTEFDDASVKGGSS